MADSSYDLASLVPDDNHGVMGTHFVPPRDTLNHQIKHVSTLFARSGGLSLNGKRRAHGIIMAMVFVILLPLFASTLRVIPSRSTVIYLHAPLQIITLIIALAGFGLGVSLARELGETNVYHPIVGYTVISCLVLFQPAMGYLQHRHFRKKGGRSLFGHFHLWFGRVIVVLGMINGGLGIRLAKEDGAPPPRSVVIAYGVVVGVVASAYLTMVVFDNRKKRRKPH